MAVCYSRYGGTEESIHCLLNRGSYMSAQVVLILLKELGKRDKMRGLPRIISLFRNDLNKFNNTRPRILDFIYHMTLSYFEISFLAYKCNNIVIMYTTLLCTSSHFPKICKPLDVYRFHCTALFHSQKHCHMIITFR